MNYYEWKAIDIEFTVRINNSVIDSLSCFRQNLSNDDPEALGILVGKVWENAFWVTNITIPNESDVRSRYLCIRPSQSAYLNLKELERLNLKSGHTLHYLGEWHTHPELYPRPSSIDYRTWAFLPKNIYYGNNVRLFIICSSADCFYDWVAVKINGQFYKLSLVS